MRKSILAVALLVCAASPLAAQTLIVETATFNNTDANPWGIGGGIAYGVPFHIDTTTLVTKVGVSNLSGTGTFYAAIVRASASGFPDGAPFNDVDVVGHVVFTPAAGDQRVPLSATLTPGDYVLVVGAGVKYGTDGSGEVATEGQVHNPAAPVFYSFSNGFWQPVYGYYTAGPDPLRFVVEGASEHQAILNAVQTRASQSSVDALAASIAAASTSAQVVNLSAQINSAFTALSGSLAGLATVGDVNTAAANVTTAVSSRASQASVDAIAESLGASGSDSVALAIERALADGRRVAGFFLPSAVGGVLEQVRELVDVRLTSAQQAGLDMTKARAQFVKGDAALSVADYKTAYDYYAAAYQLLIK